MESAKVRLRDRKKGEKTRKSTKKGNRSKTKAAALHFLIEKFSDFRVSVYFLVLFFVCLFVICVVLLRVGFSLPLKL